jgi:hypothetical protein
MSNEPTADASDRELAEHYDTVHARDDEWGEPEPVGPSKRLDVTLSVRFSPSEIAAIRSRAEAAGMKTTAYIRQCALAAEATPIDRERLARTVDALTRDLNDLRRAAS